MQLKIASESEGVGRGFHIYRLGVAPFPVIVTTRVTSCLVGDSYKASFATITGKGATSNLETSMPLMYSP